MWTIALHGYLHVKIARLIYQTHVSAVFFFSNNICAAQDSTLLQTLSEAEPEYYKSHAQAYHTNQ